MIFYYHFLQVILFVFYFLCYFIIMKLYYGADKIITRPVFGLGNPSNDYGLGLYLTPSKDAAFLWASRFPDGYVMTYEIDESKLNILKLNSNDESDILHWIALLAKNRFDRQERIEHQAEIEWLMRKFPTDLSQYDMVIGYRADDSYFAYSSGFVKGNISIETLARAMKIGKLGLQYVLISQKAFSILHYVSSEKTSGSYSYDSFRKTALDEYHDLITKENLFENHFIRDLMRKYGI